jgi:hypothetical protein
MNADYAHYTIKDKLSMSSPSHVILEHLCSLVMTQVHNTVPSGSMLKFWIEVFFSFPNWFKEANVLYLLDNVCMAAFGNEGLHGILYQGFIEQYKVYIPIASHAITNHCNIFHFTCSNIL